MVTLVSRVAVSRFRCSGERVVERILVDQSTETPSRRVWNGLPKLTDKTTFGLFSIFREENMILKVNITFINPHW